ncbi:MAG: ABC transporter permease [Muribaculum sp.]|nr:ABC transporter permease [Muribaculum sp.]
MKHAIESNALIWRLVRHNISPAQLVGYALSNLVGLAIILTALQLYMEASSVLESDDSLMSRDFICLSPKVDGLGPLTGSSLETIDSATISDIQRQPWARRVGVFTSARYNVAAYLDMGGRNMSTSLFFESVPDEFFDKLPPGWTFSAEQPEIPIVISKDYLTLYNFGFASTHGLPQLSEAMIGLVPLKVSVSGRGRQQWFPARIAGFSSRLNTIAVPEEFMQWANDNFGEGSPTTSRVIVELSQPGNPDIKEFLNSHDLEMAGDKADTSATAYFLAMLTAVVIGIGVAISLLSFFILILSIHLLLQKSRDKLRDLMLLGYSPSQVARPYYRLIAIVNVSVGLLAVAAMLAARAAIHSALSTLQISFTNPWATISIGAAVIIAGTLMNFAFIRRKIIRYFD